MLFVIYGATLEMGFRCREILHGLGFSIIKKYNYVSDDTTVNKSLYIRSDKDKNYANWYNDKIYVESYDEIKKCDFQYSLDGVCIGFNKEEIFNAVHGKDDAVLTIGASSIEFILQLKKAYGNYITLINLFSDRQTVMHDNQIGKIMNKAEVETRNSANQKMQKVFLEHLDKFDETVIYTGEDSIYNLSALQFQLETIINKRRILEKELNSINYVELPYKGNNPYLFVSYSHKNRDQVHSELLFLQRHSCRVWYDDGIRGGENWRKIICDKICNCNQFVFFLSQNSVNSFDIFAEINLALDLHKNFIIVNLDNSELPTEYKMYLMNSNQLNYESRDYHEKLLCSINENSIEK